MCVDHMLVALVPVEFNGVNPQSDIYFSFPPGPWEPRAADTSPAWAAESLLARSEQEGLEDLPEDDPSGTSAGEGTLMASESGTNSWERSVPLGAQAAVGREVWASGKASESVPSGGSGGRPALPDLPEPWKRRPRGPCGGQRSSRIKGLGFPCNREEGQRTAEEWHSAKPRTPSEGTPSF